MLWSIKNKAKLLLFLYNGDLLTAMNDVLAIIAGGGRAIIVIDREGVEINYILL
jgi:glycerate-2-kinase